MSGRGLPNQAGSTDTCSQDNKNRPLPDGWRWVQLREVCDLNPRRPELRREEIALTTFIPMSAVEEGGGGIKRPEQRQFREVRKGYTYFREGDVLFAKITPCMQNGKHAIARGLLDGVGFGSTEFHVLRPREGIISEWILRFILQPRVLEEATAYFSGSVGQQRVPEDYLLQLRLPLPPLAEQKRIAGILNEQMASVEKARAAAEAQLDAAKQLPASCLRAVFNSSVAQQWPKKPIHEVSSVAGGIQKSPSRAPSVFHRPFLTVRNVQRGWLDLTNVERFEITPNELERCRLQKGDLLVVEGNGSRDHIGRNAIFNNEIEDCIHQNHVIRVRFDVSKVDSEFISLYLNSNDGRAQMLEKAKTTTGLYTLSVNKVEELEIPVPHLSEQHSVAARLSEQMTAVEQTRKALEAQLAAINALPAALLRHAFQGAV